MNHPGYITDLSAVGFSAAYLAVGLAVGTLGKYIARCRGMYRPCDRGIYGGFAWLLMTSSYLLHLWDVYAAKGSFSIEGLWPYFWSSLAALGLTLGYSFTGKGEIVLRETVEAKRFKIKRPDPKIVEQFMEPK